jgi:CubicO group peptidase (beta-lactamase class C family)
LGVARIAKTSLEDYCRQNIFAPLNITEMTFWPERQPEFHARLAGMTVRDSDVPDGKGRVLAYSGPSPGGVYAEEFGGQGAYGTMPEFMKILRSLLADDEKLVKKETAVEMFRPQLNRESQKSLQETFGDINRSRLFVGKFPEHVRYDWALGGLLTMQDVTIDGVQWRRRGCMVWSGMPNLFWVSFTTCLMTPNPWDLDILIVGFAVPRPGSWAMWCLWDASTTSWRHSDD